MASSLAQVYGRERNAVDAITTEMANNASAFLRGLEAIKARNGELAEQMAALQEQGLIYATVYWRPDKDGEDKYLYLHFPPERGKERTRQYIGADPEKIAAAKTGIARAKHYDALAAEQAELRKRIDDAHLHLEQASYALAGKPRLYRAW